MLKRGITTLRGLERPRTLFGRQRHASLLLFAELAARPDGDRDADRLVERVRLPNGTWKLTGAGRLADVDGLLCAQLRDRPRAAPLTVLDLGASTGVTSVSLYERLRREHDDVTFIASDLYRDALAVRGRGWTVLLTVRGEPLQYLLGPFVLPAQLVESPLYAGNRALKRLAERRLLPRARAALAALAGEPPEEGTVPVDGLQVSRFSLLAACCRARLRSDARFRFEVIDVLQPLPGRATVVRALNVVTGDNFDALQLRRALRHCIAAVEPGGLLVLGRTPLGGGETRATCYRRTADGLLPVARLRGGCEHEALTCRLAAAAAAGERTAACALPAAG